MRIILNNRDTEISDYSEISVSDLLKYMNFVFPNIVVKVNGKLVKKDNRTNFIISDGDKVDAIHMISGG